MSRAAEREVAARLASAWSRGECLRSVTDRGRHLLRARMASGELISPYPGLYDTPDHWQKLNGSEKHLHVLRALSSARPGWVFCQRSAAVAHGILQLAPRMLLKPQALRSPRSHAIRSKEVEWHPAGAYEPRVAGGVPVTDIVRTTFDCLRSLVFCSAMPVADAALAKLGWTPDELLRSFDRFSGYRGVATARRRALLSDARCENGGESMLRARILALGFACPRMQVELVDPLNPDQPYRPDCLWLPPGMSEGEFSSMLRLGELSPGSLAGGVAGELDGWDKYVNPQMAKDGFDKAVLDERRRESRLTLLGLKFVRFSYAEACSDSYVERMLLAAGVPRLSAPLSGL